MAWDVGRGLPHELVDPALELGDRIERTASDGLLRDKPEPAFDLVEPRAVDRREVEVEARTALEPRFDLGVLVGAVVIADPFFGRGYTWR